MNISWIYHELMATMDLPSLGVPQPVRIGTPGRWKKITKIWQSQSTSAPVPGSLESQYLSIFQPLAAGSWCRMIYQPSSYSPQALTPWPVKTLSDATAMRPLAEIGGSFDNLINDGGKTKSAKSQLIKNAFVCGQYEHERDGCHLKCAPSLYCICSKMSKMNHQAIWVWTCTGYGACRRFSPFLVSIPK